MLSQARETHMLKWIKVINTVINESTINDILNYLLNPIWNKLNSDLIYHDLNMWYWLLEFTWWLTENAFLEQKNDLFNVIWNHNIPKECGYFYYNWKRYLIISKHKMWDYVVNCKWELLTILTL